MRQGTARAILAAALTATLTLTTAAGLLTQPASAQPPTEPRTTVSIEPSTEPSVEPSTPTGDPSVTAAPSPTVSPTGHPTPSPTATVAPARWLTLGPPASSPVAGPFDFTSRLRVESGVAGTYRVRVDGVEQAEHRVEAGACTAVEGCTFVSALTAAPHPFGRYRSSAPTRYVYGVLTLDDGTVTTRGYSVTTPFPGAAAGLSVDTPLKGRQTTFALYYDRPTTVRLHATKLPDGSPLAPAEAFTVSVSGYDRDAARHEVAWQQEVLATGPPEARYADVVIDPDLLTRDWGMGSTLTWATVHRLAPRPAGARTDAAYRTHGNTTTGLNMLYDQQTVQWTTPPGTEGPTTVHEAFGPRATAVVTLPLASQDYSYPRWITGLRSTVTETRVHAGVTTRRTLEGQTYPWYWNITRTAPMTVDSYVFGYQAPGPGQYTFDWQLYTDDGMAFGDVHTTRTTVLAPALKVTAAPLVVGRPAKVTVTATYPWADTMTMCHVTLEEGAGRTATSSLSFCPGASTAPASATRSGTVTVTPHQAGIARWQAQLRQTPSVGVTDFAHQAVTVHAERLPSVAVPDATLGSRTAAVLMVRDIRSWGGTPVGTSGATVDLWRRAAGATTWTRVGSYTTGTGGVVSVPVTVSATPMQWRATSGNGAGAWYSAVDSSRALPKLAWSGGPASVRKGRTATFTVAVTPAEPGSAVHLQVKAPGSTVWSTVLKKAVPNTSTSATKTSTVSLPTTFSRTGTWQVRTVRPASSRYGQAVSSLRQVTVTT